ncbi:MAG: substrate-binding domain-containing protein [Candidatus Eiseniibacteriota bacterium]|nr:MAG: substrate-binding domain-containing protein [Candidatus Eisenbacteria bacterium]
MRNRRLCLAVATLFVSLFLAHVPGGPGAHGSPDSAIRLATTTSTDNTGLLGLLLPPFTARYGVEVQVIAVGTGAAIALAEKGDVDVILVHDRVSEDAFIEKGFGVNPREVMHNDFVIVGPSSDPAGIMGLRDASAALGKIAARRSLFVSRGDESGTHKKEKRLWHSAGVRPEGGWYWSAGQGMGAVLVMADEKRAYTLTDRGTYLAFKKKMDLSVLVEGDARLFNPYRIIAVNPALHPHVKYVEVMALIGWLTSREGQELIANFKIDDETLFFPDAIAPGRTGD